MEFPKQKEEISTGDLRFPQWSSSQYPYYPWVPKTIRFEGPLFSRLNFDYYSLPINPSAGRYTLARYLREKWMRLEHNLQTFASALLTKTSNSGRYPKAFTLPRFPSTNGYLQSHPTEEDARYFALYSRDAFVPLMAMCSFAIANNLEAHEFASSMPKWLIELASQNVNQQYLQLIRTSIIGDFSIERVGVVLDPFKWDCREQINRMVRGNVPVWIYWGQKWKDGVGALGDCLPPNENQVREAQKKFFQPTHPQVEHVNDAPEPQKGSRQLRGETWRSFFARQEGLNNARRQRESEKERQARESREKSANMPGKRGPRVFEWVDTDGFLLRMLVERSRVEDVWEDYGPHQRKFNGFTNEWDLCHKLDPHDKADGDRFDEYCEAPAPLGTVRVPAQMPAHLFHSIPSRSVNARSFPASPPPPPSLPAPPLPPSNYLAAPVTGFPRAPTNLDDLNNLQLDMVFNDSGRDDPEGSYWDSQARIDRLDDAIYERYGAILSSEDKTLENETEWRYVRWTFGHDEIDFPRRFRLSVITFLKRMTAGLDYPVPQRDISMPEHRDMIGQSFLSITVLDQSLYSIRGAVVPADRDVDWILIVPHPETVLQCVRAGWDSRLNVGRELVKRGISFKTMFHLPHPGNPPPLKKYPCIGLGSRDAGYKPDAVDYADYERSRDALLREPHGRAALLAGGILWRLAFDTLGITPALDGPSSNALSFGSRLRTRVLGTTFDDALTQEEEGLICGEYKIYTCEFDYLMVM